MNDCYSEVQVVSRRIAGVDVYATSRRLLSVSGWKGGLVTGSWDSDEQRAVMRN